MSITPLWALAVYFGAVVLVVAGMLVLSWLLGPRHRQPQTAQPYEGGIVSTGSARVRFDASFYLVAMFFVVFDLEAAFLFAWAVAAREVGWAGYVEMLVFVVVLAAALFYLWRLGALDWGAYRRQVAFRGNAGRDGHDSRGNDALVSVQPE
ncbi:MAG: NADH-quinone oxidoreductase subunit A [Chthonomonadales bacterium]|nr:NADH-quinone oxidoreductase subunit A [Chthonomonadales bacterium]